MLSDKLTVLINSCDGYGDLWYPFFTLYHKYWAEGRDLKIILNTERKHYHFDGLSIQTHNSENPHWGGRLWETLKEIDTEYVLMLLDDFFFDDNVYHKGIEECIRVMDKNKKTSAISLQRPYFGENQPSNYDFLDLRKNGDSYTVSCQPGIWRKSALMRLVNRYETPWQFELFGSQRTKLHPRYSFYILSESAPDIIHYHWRGLDGCGVHHGKWQTGTPELFRKNGIEMDFQRRGFVGEQLELVEYRRAKCNFDDSILALMNTLSALKRKILSQDNDTE